MAWLKLIESAGNHLLALDPDFLDQLRPFYSKTFRIELIEPEFSFDLRPCPDGFIIEAASDTSPEVKLRGSLWAFAQLAREGSHSRVFSEGRIIMEGDAELGQAFQRLLGRLDIDWEELSSKLLGEMAARQVHRLIDDLGSWFRQSSEHFRENTGEFLQQELKITPAGVEVDAMAEEIDHLRADAARLEARIARLQKSIQNPEDRTDA